MKKYFLFVVSIILLTASIASAQTTQLPVVKQISAGVVNGKAISLAKPAYPSAARAVSAEGAVNVQVTIDEEGNVVSASAVSGHPLLRQAAEQAAVQSKFNPTVLSGQVVKVTGVIVYNFVAGDKTPNWFKVGYDLASAQHASSLIFLNTNLIAKTFQPEWTTEKEQLQKLAEIKQAEPSIFSEPVVISERRISENTRKNSDGTVVRKVTTQRVVKSDGTESTGEQISASQSLIASLQSRLANDELNLWQFNTGVSLSWAVSHLRYTNERQRVLSSLRQQVQSAPSKVSPEFLAELQKIAAILEKPNPTPDERQQTVQLMRTLFLNQ